MSEQRGAVVTRETFGGTEVAQQAELSAVAGAAAAKAEVESRIIAAQRWPRDEDMFREKFTRACENPSFADIALYDRPVGRQRNPQTGEWEDKHIVDWSIRGMETALQAWGRVHTSAHIVYEDERQVQLRVTVMDLQNILSHSSDVTVEKTVERKGDKRADRGYISSRQNSAGEMVHRYEATPEEVRSKVAAERSKLLRDNGKRILPRHVLDEARAIVDKVMADENARDPDAAKKKVMDRFSSIGVTPDMLKAYLDRSLDGLTPKDIAELAVLFNGLKDGEFTWADVMRIKQAAPDDPGPLVAAEAPGKKEKLKDKIARAREAARSKETPPEKQEG